MGILGVLAVVGFILWAITSGCDPNKPMRRPRREKEHPYVYRRVLYNDAVWAITAVEEHSKPEMMLYMSRVKFSGTENNVARYVPISAIDEMLSIEEGRKHVFDWDLN